MVKFKNKSQVEDLLKFSNFVRAKPEELEKKVIPIIKKPGPPVQEEASPGLDGDFNVEAYLTNRVDDNHVLVVEEEVIVGYKKYRPQE